jgi:hypothetical protein
VSGFFSGVAGAAAGFFTGAVGAASGFFSGVTGAAAGFFTGAVGPVSGFFSGVAGAAAGFFTGAFGPASGFFSGVAGAAAGFFTGAFGPVSVFCSGGFAPAGGFFSGVFAAGCCSFGFLAAPPDLSVVELADLACGLDAADFPVPAPDPEPSVAVAMGASRGVGRAAGSGDRAATNRIDTDFAGAAITVAAPDEDSGRGGASELAANPLATIHTSTTPPRSADTDPASETNRARRRRDSTQHTAPPRRTPAEATIEDTPGQHSETGFSRGKLAAPSQHEQRVPQPWPWLVPRGMFIAPRATPCLAVHLTQGGNPSAEHSDRPVVTRRLSDTCQSRYVMSGREQTPEPELSLFIPPRAPLRHP